MDVRVGCRLKRKLFIFFMMFILLIPLVYQNIEAGENDLNLIDVPKTYTSYRGDMHFGFTMYDGGGVIGSAILSISDFAFLGVYFDIGNIIGSQALEWNQPGVIARFLISDGAGTIPRIAIGYSYFMKGGISKINGVLVNGLYAVASQQYFLFGNQQTIFYGLRYPIIPLDYSRPENTSLFIGTDIILSPQFSIKGEIENFYLNQKRWDEVYYNFAFSVNIVDMISLSLEFKYSPHIDRFIRLLSIGYITQF